MSDPFKTVSAGEPVELHSRAWNTLMEMAGAHRKRPGQGAAPQPDDPPRTSFVRIKNNSGVDVAKFGILGVDEPVLQPQADARSLRHFKNHTVFYAVTPVVGAHAGRFVVLRQPLAHGKVGIGYYAGGYVAQVSVVDEAHQFADVKDADNTQLLSGWGGSARILWREPGTGTRWAVVLLGGGDVGQPQYQGMVLAGVAQNVRGWDFPRASALPGV